MSKGRRVGRLKVSNRRKEEKCKREEVREYIRRCLLAHKIL